MGMGRGRREEREKTVGIKRIERLGCGIDGVWFDKLTMKAGCGWFVGCCWVPAGDAGMTLG